MRGRGVFSRMGSSRAASETVRHGEAASSAMSSSEAMNLAHRMQRLLVDEKLQDVTFSVGEVSAFGER